MLLLLQSYSVNYMGQKLGRRVRLLMLQALLRQVGAGCCAPVVAVGGGGDGVRVMQCYGCVRPTEMHVRPRMPRRLHAGGGLV